MRVLRDSWHYRLADMASGSFSRPSPNLCLYFWQVVGGALVWAFLAAMGAFIAVGLVLLTIDAWRLLAALPGGLWPAIQAHEGGAIPLALLAAVVAGVSAAIWRERRGDVESEPGIVRQYLAAKKARICPLIGFEDGER